MISLYVKVLELQDHVSRLQTLNSELQSQLSQIEKSERDTDDKEDKDRKKQLQRDEVVHKVMAAKFLFLFFRSSKRVHVLSFISNVSSRVCPHLENT